MSSSDEFSRWDGKETEFILVRVGWVDEWVLLNFLFQIYLKLNRKSGEGNGNTLQYSCLENPRDGGAWWAAVYGVTQGRTRLKRLSSSSSKQKITNVSWIFKSFIWLYTFIFFQLHVLIQKWLFIFCCFEIFFLDNT